MVTRESFLIVSFQSLHLNSTQEVDDCESRLTKKVGSPSCQVVEGCGVEAIAGGTV